MPEVRRWDGRSYDRVSGPQFALGMAVIDRLELAGDETVLDAGCGSGRLTEVLIERVPRGRVIAVDVSESMLAAARERLGPSADIRRADLTELRLDEQADAILSTATLHWIADHERVFERLRAALRPGGRLSAQCGGEGNTAELRARVATVAQREPFAARLASFKPPWNYAGPAETERRLRAAGFATADCWLQPAPTEPEHPREFLATVMLGPLLQHLPVQLREPFTDEVLAALGEPVVVDYVRLNIDATA